VTTKGAAVPAPREWQIGALHMLYGQNMMYLMLRPTVNAV